MFTIVARSEWRAEAPRKTNPLAANPKGIVVHHTVTPAGGDLHQRVKNIQHHHRNINQWHDIAYSFMIGQNGTIFEARGFGIQQGATATPRFSEFGNSTQYANHRYYAVCFIGDFENDHTPTVEAINAFRWLRSLLMAEHSTGLEVRAHQEFKIDSNRRPLTLCPGKHLIAVMDRLRQPFTIQDDEPVSAPNVQAMLELEEENMELTKRVAKLETELAESRDQWTQIRAIAMRNIGRS